MHNPTLRVMEILNLLCETGQPLRLNRISRELEIPKSTLLPILQTLTEGGYLSRDSMDGYCPGPALLRIGAAAGAAHSPGEAVRERLKALVDRFGETCYYGVLEGSEVLYLEKMDSPNPLRMLTTIGHRLPAYSTGLGKALLLDKTPEQLKKLYPDKLPPLTKNTVRDLKTLSQQLQQMRTLGYCWETEESTDHIRCFAAPVRRNGEIQGAVSIAIPIFRYREEEKETVVEALKKTAEEITEILDYTL